MRVSAVQLAAQGCKRVTHVPGSLYFAKERFCDWMLRTVLELRAKL
jgi:hypothetical protein